MVADKRDSRITGSNSVVLVELCSGSAALTRKLCGLVKLVGFMGAKDRYAQQIIDIWGIPCPQKYILNDPGFWGIIWDAYCRGHFIDVANTVESWSKWDPKQLFDFIKDHKSIGDLAFKAAARLCLLAGTFGGGEIGGFKGKHKLRPSVDGFIPSRYSLSKRIRNFAKMDCITSSSECATFFTPKPGCWVYIDPPYSGLSGYEHDLTRRQVLDVAICWKNAGCQVAISESIPLEIELGQGWQSKALKTTSGQCRKNAKSDNEFLTYTVRR